MLNNKEIKNSKGEVFIQAQGVVKSFNENTGFGFIFSVEEPNEDIFFHYSQILVQGKKVLQVGDNVEFLYKQVENKGLRAYSIRKID